MNLKQTQQQKLLEALQQAPVNSYKATYLMGIKQAPTRIKELREMGYSIDSEHQSNRSVNWVLRNTSVQSSVVLPNTTEQGHYCGDWYRAYPKAVCSYCQPRQGVLL